LFAGTLFLSAVLLFLVQPMMAKMVLPLLGGTPAVWNTCMVFFQAALLGGYLYAHLTTTWLDPRRQVLVHGALVLVPALCLPLSIGTGWVPSGDANPIPWLLGLMVVSVGLPFFVIATSAPLLQRWFAETGHPAARDPYVLYAASNLGSMAALLGYPVLLEPCFRLTAQSWMWSIGYGLLVLLVLGCAAIVWRSSGKSDDRHDPSRLHADWSAARLGWKLQLRWLALAFVPSSLMLGVTTYMTTDIAAIPLLWVMPLALYLLSFILVFARIPPAVHRLMAAAAPVLIVSLIFMMISGLVTNISLVIALHLATFFVMALFCHGALARSRPGARHLTAFYLWMSLGGMLGGMFNALLAPMLFRTLLEYVLVLTLGCLLLPAATGGRWQRWLCGTCFAAVILGGHNIGWLLGRLPQLLGGVLEGGLDLSWAGLPPGFEVIVMSTAAAAYILCRKTDRTQRALDVGLPLLLGLFAAGLMFSGQGSYWGLGTLPLHYPWLTAVATIGLPLAACWTLRVRPVRFGLGLAAVLLASALVEVSSSDVVYRVRSFFGAHRVERQTNHVYRFYHGTTLHGLQSRAETERSKPFAYFHQRGPIGQVFDSYRKAGSRQRLAVLGLGIGTLACYGQAGDEYTFYEIDPEVERIAEDPEYFTFLQDARHRGVGVQVVLGDGRLKLAEAPENHYDILIADAFSSDAIPVHLITAQALELYLGRLTEDGLLAFQITNRYVNLEPVLYRLAQHFGLRGLIQYDPGHGEGAGCPSTWVVLARRPDRLGPLLGHHAKRWRPLAGQPGVGLWSDDFSNLLSVFSWK
jgi:hypothetical protein